MMDIKYLPLVATVAVDKQKHIDFAEHFFRHPASERVA